MKILLKNASVNGVVQNLLVNKDRIDYIGKNTPDAELEYDLTGKILIPGIIDPHTHIRDLGQADKEDWRSASQAAIRGGTTMVFDMPNNKPPTINLENLNLKREKALKSLVHYKFNIAATSYNLPQVVEILNQKPDDVAALKLFLAGSNSNEYVNDMEVIKRIFDISLQYDLPVIVHTEWQACVEQYAQKIEHPNVFDHNKIRHPECAVKGTEIVARLAAEIGNKLYIAHTSVAEEFDIIKAYKSKANIYCEVTPHHLLLNEDILQTAGNYGKVNPPLRTLADNKAALKAVKEGIVDVSGTDHAPHKLIEKQLDYSKAPSGFPGLETHLPLLLNEVNKGNLSLEKVMELTAANPARIFNIKNRGKLKEGYMADITVVDMNKQWTVKAENFKTKAKYSPFEGMTGTGDVCGVIINGIMIES